MIVDIIKAKKQPDESDLKLKETVDQKEVLLKDAIIELTEQMDAGFLELKKDIQILTEQNNILQKNQRASIRHEITTVYYQYYEKKKIPPNIKQDMCFLFEAYTNLGGNSYIHELYEEMKNWEIE